MHRRSLEFIILVPVLIFLILAGTSLYFMILTSVENFADRSIRENLSSLSNALESIADRAVDELNIKGYADDEKQTKRYKVKVFLETENFARQNEIGIIVYSVTRDMIVFETGISEETKTIATQGILKLEHKISIPDTGTYYYRSVEFNPWNWRITLFKNAAAYSSLLQKVLFFYIATGIILLLIAIFLIVYLRRVISRPIKQIVKRLEEGSPPAYTGIRELEILSDSFSQIMKSLQERTLQLEAAKVKNRFLANMSHELRTPLNSIIGFTDIVKRKSGDILPEKQKENLEKVLISSDYLRVLINDILDQTKIQEGLLPIHPTDFNLEPLVNECLHTIEPMVKEKNLILVKSFMMGRSSIYTDKIRVKQILINLLSNAVKFTDKGSITVAIEQKNEAAEISVIDTGVGISKDKQERLFEAFWQEDGDSTRQHKGTGLGLSISQGLAVLMGGDIVAESTQGVGSKFKVTIPIHYATTKPEEYV